MKRIAAPIISGMISTLLLVLIVFPAIYFYWKSTALKRLDQKAQ